MKRKFKYFLLVIFILVTFSGCSSITNYGFTITESMVYVKSKNSIISISVEDFDEDTYSEKDLKKEIKEEVKQYNKSALEEGGMTFVNLDVKKSVATLELEFKSDEDYSAYHSKYVYYGSQVIMLTGTINELLKEDIPFDGKFKKIDKDSKGTATLKDLKAIEDLKVAVFNEGIKVRVKGDIIYTSENVTVKDGLATTTLGEYNYIFYK